MCVGELIFTSEQACQQLVYSKCLNSKKAHTVIIFCCGMCVHPYTLACIRFSFCKVAGRKYGMIIIIEGLNCPYTILNLAWTVIKFWIKSNYTSVWVILVKFNSLWNYHQWEWKFSILSCFFLGWGCIREAYFILFSVFFIFIYIFVYCCFKLFFHCFFIVKI